MAVKFRDYYETLGVPRDASEDQIKKAYRSPYNAQSGGKSAQKKSEGLIFDSLPRLLPSCDQGVPVASIRGTRAHELVTAKAYPKGKRGHLRAIRPQDLPRFSDG